MGCQSDDGDNFTTICHMNNNNNNNIYETVHVKHNPIPETKFFILSKK
jgi:hypothetical protein